MAYISQLSHPHLMPSVAHVSRNLLVSMAFGEILC